MHNFTCFIEMQYVKYCAVECEFISFRIKRLVFSRNAVYEPAGCELNVLHKTPLEILCAI
jgi:hypothetical protein